MYATMDQIRKLADVARAAGRHVLAADCAAALEGDAAAAGRCAAAIADGALAAPAEPSPTAAEARWRKLGL